MSSHDINTLRHLLELYYKGETNPAQEAILGSMLRSPIAVGDEFAADRALFAALYGDGDAFAGSDAWNDAPAALGRRLEVMTARSFASRTIGRVPRFVRYITYGAMAACVAALLVVVGGSGGADRQLASAGGETDTLTVTVNAGDCVEMTVDTLMVEEPVERAIGQEEAPAPAPSAPAKVKARKKVMRHAAPRTETLASADVDDSTPGLTPETASAVATAALRALSQTLALSQAPIRETQNSIDQVNNTLNKINIEIK